MRCEGDRRLRSEIGALNPIGDFGLATLWFACYLLSGVFATFATIIRCFAAFATVSQHLLVTNATKHMLFETKSGLVPFSALKI